jgi:transcription elongation factor Elf1
MRALRRCGRPRRLVDCEQCGRDFVIPVSWSDLDAERWSIHLRCGECGSSREVVVDNDEARRFEADLDRGTREIARSLARAAPSPRC